MADVTIFEQDRKVYTALSHSMPVKDLAKETARGIREMVKIPRAKMRVVSREEFVTMPFASPNGEPLSSPQQAEGYPAEGKNERKG